MKLTNLTKATSFARETPEANQRNPPSPPVADKIARTLVRRRAWLPYSILLMYRVRMWGGIRGYKLITKKKWRIRKKVKGPYVMHRISRALFVM